MIKLMTELLGIDTDLAYDLCEAIENITLQDLKYLKNMLDEDLIRDLKILFEKCRNTKIKIKVSKNHIDVFIDTFYLARNKDLYDLDDRITYFDIEEEL